MITIIAGTNRTDSNSSILAAVYAAILRSKNQKCRILDLKDLPSDFIISALYDNVGKDPGFNILSKVIEESSKFVFVVPEYNGSFPGVLKAFIDGLPYPGAFRNKKAALVGFSNGSQGGLLALSHLTDIFNYLGMHILASKVRIPHIGKHLQNGQLSDSFYTELLENQAAEIMAF